MTPLLVFAAALSVGSAQYLGTPYAAYSGYDKTCAYGACGNMYAGAAYAAAPYAAAQYAAAPYAGAAYAAAPYAGAAYAAPYARAAYAAPTAAVAAPLVAPTSYIRKYQTQDELGRATFGHEQLTQKHAAVRDALGNVAGAYSYISPEGKVIKARYTAGINGVQVESNALPVAPVETRAAPIFTGVAPAPVQLTAEVRAATLEHLEAIKKAKKEDNKREKRAAGYPAELTEVILNPGHATAYRVDPISPLLFRKRRAAAGYPAELTEVILNPGHATAYRVDAFNPLLAF